MSESSNERRRSRAAHLRWVAIAEMKVNPRAQREFRPDKAAKIAAELDLEALGYPVVNRRDGHYYIVDGQHRIAALKLIGYGDQQIQCDCLEGLTEAEEAELFLRRDERTAISTYDKFRIAITAEREVETDIDRIVRAQGLVVSRNKNTPHAVSAVGTLRKVYTQAGPIALGRALRIIRDAYGDAGLEAPVIHGIGLLCQRYNGRLNDELAVQRLSKLQGSVGALLASAEKQRLQSGNQKSQCVAAAAVDVINAGQRGKTRLPDWWRPESGA
ncbi:MAG TPA: DUF6551 family protein [Mycobacteriales bacterium]|nr:DUF6551 family protein [Mycobacteriales bacterium]